MKHHLLGISLFTATATAVALYPTVDGTAVAGTDPQPQVLPVTHPQPPAVVAPAIQAPRIEVVFALDTTGSMGGLISAAKEKIWSIASTMAQAEPAPEIRMGLVAYRDRGDDYVTRRIDLSSDLDSMYAALMDFSAAGGGDGPESVNRALDEAVNAFSWSQDDNVYRVVFLVGDAPPHMDYQDERQYPDIVAEARSRGIVVNAIRCGGNEQTRAVWQHIAALSDGDFFNVGQDGSALAMATPFDAELARLSAAMDDTRAVFGDAAAKAEHKAKRKATAKLHAHASDASRARRAAFNASAAGSGNFLGEHDLVEAVTTGRVTLDAVAPAALPAELRDMTPAAREAEITRRADERAGLKAQIATLAEKRDRYLEEEIAEAGGDSDSLDRQLFDTVSEQAAEHGLRYGPAPKY